MRRVSILTVISIIFSMMVSLRVEGESSLISSSRIEGVLVVDVSNSMLTSDPNHLSKEAMKMFIDMSSLKGDKIGVIAYANEVVGKMELTKLQAENDQLKLKGFIDSLQKFPNTDLSAGVQEAVSILSNGHEQDYLPLIVLLADGNNDVNPNKGLTEQQSADNLNAAVEEAKLKGYPIYVIGLNADGKLNKDVLQNIATTTEGKFFETSNAEELPGILSEIFANHLKLKVVPVEELVGKGEFQDVTISVPNTNVLEANLSFVSSQPVEIKLLDPSGKEQTLPSETIQFTTSKSYSMIKLINPVQGNWTLKVKGAPADKIDINFIFNYDLQLTLEPLANKDYKTGDTVKIRAYFEDNGSPILDNDLYITMKPTLFITDLQTGEIKEYPLTADDQGFTGDFTIGRSKDYEIIVKAEGDSFFRETAPVKFSVQTLSASAPKTVTEQEEPETPSSLPWLYLGILMVGVLVVILSGIAILKKRKQSRQRNSRAGYPGFFLSTQNRRGKRGFFGQITLQIKDELSGELTELQAEKLKAFKGEFILSQLFKLPEEYAQADRIKFVPLTESALLLLNPSDGSLEMNGNEMDGEDYYRFRQNDRLRIYLKEAHASIYVSITSLEKKKPSSENLKQEA